MNRQLLQLICHALKLDSILRGSIESTKFALPGNARRPTPMLLHSGQVVIQDGRMIKPNAASSATSLSIVDTAAPQERTSINRDGNAPGAGMVIITNVDEPDDVQSASSSEAFAGISLLADDAPEDIEVSHEEQMELWGAIRTVQRKIVKLADEAVANSLPASDRIETSGVHSENPPPSSDRIETRSAHSETSNTTTANRNTLAAQSDQSTYPLQPQIAVAEASQDVIRFLDTLGNDFEIPFISIRSWQVSFIMGRPRLFLLLKLFRL